ncbi:MAG TPA: hypothetical protein DEB32_09310 [Stenotrophomonas sp.]|nr:hypothetical protein G9274_001324 [Stenotrophomonas rhizophila]HBS62902.1 hypothetical protein [Stenotrophomonas sp.]
MASLVIEVRFGTHHVVVRRQLGQNRISLLRGHVAIRDCPYVAALVSTQARRAVWPRTFRRTVSTALPLFQSAHTLTTVAISLQIHHLALSRTEPAVVVVGDSGK